MLAHLRHTHLRRTSCSSWPAAIRSRRLASASVVHEEEVEENDDTRGSRGDEGVGSKDPKYGVWLETEGKKYEQPYRPRNWLGGEVVESVFILSMCPAILRSQYTFTAFSVESLVQATYSSLGPASHNHLQRIHVKSCRLHCAETVRASQY